MPDLTVITHDAETFVAYLHSTGALCRRSERVEAFGIKQSQVSAIVRRESWKHCA